MKKIAYSLSFIVGIFTVAGSASNIQFEELSHGFYAMYEQADPFDSNARDYVYFKKDEFYFRCDAISFRDPSKWITYDSFSLEATVALKVDSNSQHKLSGTYSTHTFGSDLVNDDRVYAAEITPKLIAELKQGDKLHASGKFGAGGWNQYSLNLKGFGEAYEKMCAGN
jgi:hypothetical protein